MAWCRSNGSAAHAIGVFIPHEALIMTSKTTNDSAASGGTIERTVDAGRYTTVARAQAELIDILVRLVIAAVESEAADNHTHRPRGQTHDRRSRHPNA
jgi:hypothetical protein